MPDKYSISHRHSGGRVGKGDKVYLRPGWYTELQLLYYIRELHAANNPKPRLVEAWREPKPEPVEMECAPECPACPEEECAPMLFDRIVARIVKTRDELWTAVLNTFP